MVISAVEMIVCEGHLFIARECGQRGLLAPNLAVEAHSPDRLLFTRPPCSAVPVVQAVLRPRRATPTLVQFTVRGLLAHGVIVLKLVVEAQCRERLPPQQRRRTVATIVQHRLKRSLAIASHAQLTALGPLVRGAHALRFVGEGHKKGTSLLPSPRQTMASLVQMPKYRIATHRHAPVQHQIIKPARERIASHGVKPISTSAKVPVRHALIARGKHR